MPPDGRSDHTFRPSFTPSVRLLALPRFEARHSVFAEQGVIGEGLHQSTDRQNIAILHFVGTAKDKLEALPKRPEFVELLKQAKVEGELKPFLGVDVARSRPK